MKKRKVINILMLIMGSLLFLYGLYLAVTPLKPTPSGSWRYVVLREERRNTFLALGAIILVIGFLNIKNKINKYFFITFIIVYLLTLYSPLFQCKQVPSGSPFQDFIQTLYFVWYFKAITALIPAIIINALVNRHRNNR